MTSTPRSPFTPAQSDVLVGLVVKVRAEILDATNRLRSDLKMPVEKALPMPPRPRYRVSAGSAPWP